MKIDGISNLNSNFYDSIMIRKIENDYIINVKSKKKINTIKDEKSFYKRIKMLSEKEKISEIIRYFISNNKICALYNGYKSHYDGKFSVINGSRELDLQIDKYDIDSKVLNEIIYKYRVDRDEIFNKNNIMKINIHQSIESSYYIVNDDYFCDEVPYIVLNLKSDEEVLLEYEKQFFVEFVKRMINESNEVLNVKYKSYGGSIYDKSFMNHSGMYIYTNDFIIRMDYSLYYEIKNIIEKHNENIKTSKVLQLKFNDYIN